MQRFSRHRLWAALTLALVASVPAFAEAPVTIDWLAYQTVAQPDPNSDVVKAVEKRFNVKFNFWYVDDARWSDTLNIKFAAGEVPDFFRLNEANLGKYIDQGIVAELPLTALRKGAPTFVKMIDQYDPDGGIWSKTYYKGKNYGFSSVNYDATFPQTVAWRTDWLKAVGIKKIPTTLAEFEKAVYAFRNNDPDGNGKKDTYGLSNSTFDLVFGAYGVNPAFSDGLRAPTRWEVLWSKKNGKYTANVTQPEVKEGLATLAKWYKDGVIDPEFITGENKGGYWALSHAFLNDRIGVTGSNMAYHWIPDGVKGAAPGRAYQEFMKLHPNAAWGTTIDLGKAITGPTGKAGMPQWGLANETFMFSTKAMKDPRKVQAVLAMLEAYATDMEYSKMVSYGIKGPEFTEDSDGNVLPGTLPDALEAAAGRRRGVDVFGFMSVYPDLVKKTENGRHVFMEQYRSPGFLTLAVPSTAAESKYKATLDKLVQETFIKIIIGAKPVSDFDTFVKTFRAQGGDAWEKDLNAL